MRLSGFESAGTAEQKQENSCLRVNRRSIGSQNITVKVLLAWEYPELSGHHSSQPGFGTHAQDSLPQNLQ